MTGVIPAGIITFLAKPYGGRSSDKVIFEQSKLITRVHIERVNQRIKVFDILDSPLPISLVPDVDNIVIVISMCNGESRKSCISYGQIFNFMNPLLLCEKALDHYTFLCYLSVVIFNYSWLRSG
nr:unnamed protein product [Callosobruchus analis]